MGMAIGMGKDLTMAGVVGKAFATEPGQNLPEPDSPFRASGDNSRLFLEPLWTLFCSSRLPSWAWSKA